MRFLVSPKSLVCLCLALIAASFVVTNTPSLHVCFGSNCHKSDTAQLRSSQFSAVQSTWTPGRQSETITMAFVVCEWQFDIGMVAIKSAIAFSTSPLNLIIAVDDKNKARLKEQVESWPASIKKRVHVQLKPAPRPKNANWTLVECQAHPMHFPSILRDVDALLYVSAGVIFVHPVEDFWRMFYSMNDQQMVGMAPEKENLYSNSYLNTSLQPFVQPFGVNTDVLLMNLTRMRAFGFERRLGILQEDIENVTLSRFQDAMNILFAEYPQGIFTFTCRWNYRVDHCSSTALCTDLPVAVVHGGVFMYTNGAFMALHTSMKEYELGESLLHGFIYPLKKALTRTDWDDCHVEFVRQLEYWRLSAHRVDMVSNRTNPLREPAY